MKFKVFYQQSYRPGLKVEVREQLVERVEADDCYLDSGFVCFRNQGTMQAIKMISCDNVLKVDLID